MVSQIGSLRIGDGGRVQFNLEEQDVIMRFGGGIHSRASEDEIDPREAKDGQNFLLDLENRELRNRPPFDLIGTVPNGSEIRGGITLLKSDGTVKTAFQAGDTVYDWDGDSTFTSIGSVDSSAKLRGRYPSHQWTLDDKVIITDINLVEQVKEWDGTTFQDVTFTDEDDNAFGDFYAKYCQVTNERATFSHVKDSSSTTRHMMVGSARADYTQITVANRPASALSEGDPFFLLTPDLKPINGHVEAFGTTILSTERGQVFNLTGESAKDFAFQDFYPGSGASGDESVAYIGNDVVYGRQGRIESIIDTDRFGDAEADDLTRWISDKVENYTGWTIVYNSRLNRVYCFPSGVGEVWVFQTSMLRGQVSPWMKWTTQHSSAFMPTFVMNMLDPSDGLEYVFFGDSAGNIYRMEGSGSSGDAGSASIKTTFVSHLVSTPLDLESFDIEGIVKYRKGDAVTATLTLLYAGNTAFNDATTISIPALSGGFYWGGNGGSGTGYWGGTDQWNAPFRDRLIRQTFVPAGQATDWQVKTGIEDTGNFQINEIRFRFRQAN